MGTLLISIDKRGIKIVRIDKGGKVQFTLIKKTNKLVKMKRKEKKEKRKYNFSYTLT